MATRRMKTRKRSCKNGKLKKPVKTKSGGKRRCKKSRRKSRRKGGKSKSKSKSKRRRQKYRMRPIQQNMEDLKNKMLEASGQVGDYAGTDDNTIFQLLDAGVDVNEHYTERGDTILMFAAYADNLDLVVTLITDFGADPNLKNYLGKTVLHRMVTADDVDIADALISNGADPNIKDNDGFSPLDYAIKYKQSIMIKVLS